MTLIASVVVRSIAWAYGYIEDRAEARLAGQPPPRFHSDGKICRNRHCKDATRRHW